MALTLLSFYYCKVNPGIFSIWVIFSTILVYPLGWYLDEPDFVFIFAVSFLVFLFISIGIAIDLTKLVSGVFKVGKLSGLPDWKLNQLLKETINNSSTEILYRYGMKTHIRKTEDIFQTLIDRYRGSIIAYKTNIRNTIDQLSLQSTQGA